MDRFPLINAGEFEDTDEYITVSSPYDDKPAGEVSVADGEVMERAIESAYEAREQMSALPRYKREKILNEVAHLLEVEREHFAQLMTSETGKVIGESRGEVDRAVFTLRTSANEALRLHGEVIPLDRTPSGEGREVIIRRFPKGVVGAISPFNYPLNLVAHKLGPAVASGCPIVLKPSSSAPITALELGRLFLEAGVPEGAISILPSSPEVGQTLAESDKIAHLTFTGSDVVGWHLKEICGKKSISLELGGNAPCIVWDVDDMEYVSERIVIGSFHNAGQSCISTQRIYINDKIYDDLLPLIVEKTEKLTVGDPSDEGTDVGPMIDEPSARQAEEWLNEAVEGGAGVLTGGEREGTLFYPTVVVDTTPDMKINSEEVFAPIVTVTAVSDYDEALTLANDTRYGLQAGVFTDDVKKIKRAYKTLEYGGVVIGDIPTYRVDHMPYGGVGDSGVGREGPRYAIEEMTEMRILLLNISD